MITGVGIAVVDHIMVIDGFKSTEGTYHCDRYIVDGGGMAATALCAASKLGSKTRLLSRIGDDLNGTFILEELSSFGVDTSGVFTLKGGRSTASFVLVDSNTGEKQFYSEAQKSTNNDSLECGFELLAGTDLLMVDGHWMEMAQKAVRWAKDHGVKVVADFKHRYEGMDELFPYIDYFIIPHFFAVELTREHDEESMLKTLMTIQPGVPIVTQGGKGGIYLTCDSLKRYQVFSIDAVDSTGAGDAFHGAFCHFLARNYDIETCLTLASAVGALNCRAFGGRRSLPSLEELRDFLAKKGSPYVSLVQ